MLLTFRSLGRRDREPDRSARPCDPKRFECLLLLDGLCDRVERLRLSFAEAEHVLETLSIPLAAIARDRVVLGVYRVS